MKRDEIATQIFCALVARDPLPQWRYLEIQRRLLEMADLAVLMAYALESRLEETEVDISTRFADKWDRAFKDSAPGPVAKAAEKKMAAVGKIDAYERRKDAGLSSSLFDE
jgi:hypothetical protein